MPHLSAVWGGGGVEPPIKFSKRGGLTGPPFFFFWGGGLVGKRGSNFFQGGSGCNFSTKDKLKYGIFNDKKSL